MSLTKYERNNTIRSDVDFKVSDVLTDPSGNVANVHVIKSDGTYLISGGSGVRDDTGEYHYFFNAGETDPLGVYVIEWYGWHNLGGSFGTKRIVQRDAIQIVDVEQ